VTEIDLKSEAGIGSQIATTVGIRLAELCQKEEELTGRPVPEPHRREIVAAITEDELAAHAKRSLSVGAQYLDAEAEGRIAGQVVDVLFGNGGFQPYLDDLSIENVNCNGCDNVRLKFSDGRRAAGKTPVAASDGELIELIRTLASRPGAEERRFDREQPSINLKLEDGSRLFAAMGVCDRPAVSIRRHRFPDATLATLRDLGTLDDVLYEFLRAAVRAKLNILISGGPGLGKTTMLRALASAIPPDERLITIEDVYELGLYDPERHPDVTAYQVKYPNTQNVGGIDQAELVRMALRGSPDRVILGEIRGEEVVSVCNVMSQGIDGSMATIHASDSRGAFGKLASYAAQAPERLSPASTALMVANSVHLVIQLKWSKGGDEKKVRVVSSIREVTNARGEDVVSNEIFKQRSDRRGVFNVAPSEDKLELLEEAGFDSAWFNVPAWAS